MVQPICFQKQRSRKKHSLQYQGVSKPRFSQAPTSSTISLISTETKKRLASLTTKASRRLFITNNSTMRTSCTWCSSLHLVTASASCLSAKMTSPWVRMRKSSTRQKVWSRATSWSRFTPSTCIQLRRRRTSCLDMKMCMTNSRIYLQTSMTSAKRRTSTSTSVDIKTTRFVSLNWIRGSRLALSTFWMITVPEWLAYGSRRNTNSSSPATREAWSTTTKGTATKVMRSSSTSSRILAIKIRMKSAKARQTWQQVMHRATLELRVALSAALIAITRTRPKIRSHSTCSTSCKTRWTKSLI